MPDKSPTTGLDKKTLKGKLKALKVPDAKLTKEGKELASDMMGYWRETARKPEATTPKVLDVA